MEVVSSCRRLVLLGDVLELRDGAIGEALEAATPVLSELGAALGSEGEVVIVPGNHDHRLLRPWLERRAAVRTEPLGLSAEVEWQAGDPLAELAKRLGPVRVRAAYPGLWLRADMYGTHGHYSDRHNTVPILERLGSGLMARIVDEPSGGPRRIEDYETTLGTLYAWIDAVAEARADETRSSVQVRAWRQLTGADGKRRSARRTATRAAFGLLIWALNRAGLGPLRAEISGHDLRRGALGGFAQALARLEIDARYVVFGHTHRAGPLPEDAHDEWLAPTGARMINTGSWIWERSFLGPEPTASPYRPGFCLLLEDGGGPPVLRPLLDEQIRDGALG